MVSGVPPNDTDRDRRRFYIYSGINSAVVEVQHLNVPTSSGSVSSILTLEGVLTVDWEDTGADGETTFRRMPGIASTSSCVTWTSAGAGSSNGGGACLERNGGGKASMGNLLAALDVKGSIDPSEYK